MKSTGNIIFQLLKSDHWNYSEDRNMETYKNSYDKNEDIMLWELYEIRYELHKELSRKTVEEINRDALRKFREWQKKYRETLLE